MNRENAVRFGRRKPTRTGEVPDWEISDWEVSDRDVSDWDVSERCKVDLQHDV
jgi:hypothetical protein